MRDNYFRQNDWFKSSRRKIKMIGFLLGMTALLTGCNDLNSQFTCPQQPGVSCQSLDQVNTLIDQGKLAGASSLTAKGTKITAQPAVIGLNKHFAGNDDTRQKLRTQDNVMRLWIAPYIDTHGNYFSASVVYHVIERGQWNGESVVRIRESNMPDMIMVARENDHV